MGKAYSKIPSNRQLQVGQEIRGILSNYFTRNEYYHPLLESNIITVSEVRISADLKNATAFIIVSNDSNKKPILELLKEISPEIRKVVFSKLNLRFSPEIRFVLDETQENTNKVESLFHLLKQGGLIKKE